MILNDWPCRGSQVSGRPAARFSAMNLFRRLRRMPLLLVADDEWIRDALVMFFESEGCRLAVGASAEEGLALLAKQSYDIILADYRLPGMSGLEFFKRLQQSHPKAYKILMSAEENPALRTEAARVSLQTVITKPITAAKIQAALACLMQPAAPF